MKYDLSRPILDRDGEPITEKADGRPDKVLTPAIMLVRAIDAPLEDDKQLTAEDSRKRFILGARILDAPDKVELKPEEVTFLQGRISRCFSTLISGQCVLALDEAMSEIRELKKSN